MTSTAHALVAGAIATKFSDPVTASILALGSHYMLDSTPHWDFGTNWRSRPKYITGIYAIGETLFGIGVSYYFFGRFIAFPTWSLAVTLSLLPDWLETPWYMFFAKADKQTPPKNASFLEKVSYSFYKVPNMFHSKTQLPLGLLTQVAAVAFFIVLLK